MTIATRPRRGRLAGGLIAAALLAAAAPGAAFAQTDADGATLLTETCGGCHSETDAGLSRISGQRKTPEGWLMTIVRMRVAHGLEISPEDQAALVRYLADTQGLAPSETEGWRYALTRDPAYIENVGEPLHSQCARCHTAARFELQRRTPEEWALHMDFHVGQFPTIEYQALGRDREWYKIAKEEIAPMLAEKLPLQTDAWDAWRAADKPDPAGEWVVMTRIPTKGAAYGALTLTATGDDYAVEGEMRLGDGTALPVSGTVRVYTGYEWRASLDVGGEAYRQVLAISEDGQRLEGRQFLRDADSLGGALTGARADGPAVLLGFAPENAPVGAATVQAVGVGLDAATADGAQLTSVEVNRFGAALSLDAASPGAVHIASGAAEGDFAFYDGIDRLTVAPDFAIARVGGGSDVAPPPVPVEFEAIGWLNGPDGAPGTDDDVRVGEIDADWSLAPTDEIAEAMEDVKFVGVMGQDGVFSPAIGGPNPERKFSTNNAGDLQVTATAAGQSASARMIVTVQRFIDPPIR